ncbi:MAG: DNA processing protein [Patiriisocius sp.]|jgi:DNA processing protein
MHYPLQHIQPNEFSELLLEIPDVPKALNYRGALPATDMKLLAVVGSRKYSNYGKRVVDHLTAGLRGYNVGIVSGLALGIDSLAHKAALQNNLYTMAVPGSGISNSTIYPFRHRPLAQQILASGGGLLSEFEPYFTATKWSFTQRNRIMAGISHATLIIEATEKSGTLITARMATDYNRELLVVPGDIFSGNSVGPHQFLKLGATPVTNAIDILHALRIDPEMSNFTKEPVDLSPLEQKILTQLREPLDIDTLMNACNLSPQEINTLLMQMEIKGLLTSENHLYRKCI